MRVSKGDQGESVAYGSAEMINIHYMQSFLQSEEHLSGVGVMCTLELRFPAFVAPWDRWEGAAMAKIASKNEAPNARTIELDLRYFIYPEAEFLSMLPSIGEISGGTLVHLLMLEPVGSETRYAAGFPNLRSTMNPITVTLEPTDVGSLSPVLEAQVVSLSKIDVNRVNLVLRMPACLDPLGGSFRLHVMLGDDVESARSSLQRFDYRSAYILSITPDVALTSGQQVIALIIRGAAYSAVSHRVAASVSLDGVACTTVEYSTDNSNALDLRITALTPTVRSLSAQFV